MTEECTPLACDGIVTALNTLVLLRHAKAEPAITTGDHERPLAPRGREQSQAVGRSLWEHGVTPDIVVCSTALRTRQTWDVAWRAYRNAGEDSALPDPVVEFSDVVYEAGLRQLVAAVTALGDDHELPQPATVIVVGHEPTISGVASYFAGPQSSDAARRTADAGFPTGAYAVIRSAAAWSQWDRASQELTAVVLPSR